MKIGVLALQGNYAMHRKILDNIDVESIYIRYPIELTKVDGLIIPGGESTTMSKLMNRMGFYKSIRAFAENNPILGTCAGLILMSNKIVDSNLKPLRLLGISTVRNGYGRQINSETVPVEFNLDNTNFSIPASFIRAPRIIEYDDNIEVIAKYDEVPVIVKSGKHMAISFHPELDNVSALHEYVFLGSKNN